MTAICNMAAYIWAGRAAELAWERGVVGALPRTDAIDSVEAMVRRRARRALIDPAAAENSTKAERAEAPTQAVLRA